MNKSKDVVESFHSNLRGNYKRKTIRVALEIIEATADTYKENYMPKVSVFDGEFTPHDWVVAAMCEAMESKKLWKECAQIDD